LNIGATIPPSLRKDLDRLGAERFLIDGDAADDAADDDADDDAAAADDDVLGAD
jgi:hypothetical protein